MTDRKRTVVESGYIPIQQKGVFTPKEVYYLPEHIAPCTDATAWVGSEEEGVFLGVSDYGYYDIVFNPDVFPLPRLKKTSRITKSWFLLAISQLNDGTFTSFNKHRDDVYYYKNNGCGFLCFESKPVYYGCLWTTKRAWVVGVANWYTLKTEYAGTIELYHPDEIEKVVVRDVRNGYTPSVPLSRAIW